MSTQKGFIPEHIKKYILCINKSQFWLIFSLDEHGMNLKRFSNLNALCIFTEATVMAKTNFNLNLSPIIAPIQAAQESDLSAIILDYIRVFSQTLALDGRWVPSCNQPLNITLQKTGRERQEYIHDHIKVQCREIFDLRTHLLISVLSVPDYCIAVSSFHICLQTPRESQDFQYVKAMPVYKLN